MVMRLSWMVLPFFTLAIASAMAGCSGHENSAPLVAPDSGVSGPNATVGFTHEGTLALTPGQVVQVSIVTSPPDHYEVSFFLLGESLDASVDRSTVVADDAGRATITLRAPDSATTFSLRASIKDGPSVDASVSVSDEGFGTIVVVPDYAGTRDVTKWTASVLARTTCKEITGLLPGEPEGALPGTAPGGEEPTINDAPVGPNLAITLRAGHSMWGCADFADLVAESVTEVKVKVVDKPIDLAATDLNVTLAFEPEPMTYAALLTEASTLLADTFFPPGQMEGTTLLDAMRAGLTAPADADFDAQRALMSWDTLAQQHLDASSGPLHDVALQWAAEGVASLGSAEDGAEIHAHLTAVGELPGQALLGVVSFGGVDAAVAGIPGDHLMSWTAAPNDHVALDGKIFWLPTRFVAAATLPGAQLQQPTVTTVHDALVNLTRCDDLASMLGPTPSCDVDCLAQLCIDALASRWAAGVDASAASAQLGELKITAGGPAEVGDTARPLGFEGEWIGQVMAGVAIADVEGVALGVATQPNDPPQ
jgi:hypothetical protein